MGRPQTLPNFECTYYRNWNYSRYHQKLDKQNERSYTTQQSLITVRNSRYSSNYKSVSDLTIISDQLTTTTANNYTLLVVW